MPAKHLTYFKVENFKKFESLELKDIGQFNLVTGDNNVGKTSLLEALTYTTERRTCLSNFHKSLLNRGIDMLPTFSYKDSGERTGIIYPKESLFSFISNDAKKQIVINAEYVKNHAQLVIIKYIPEVVFFENITKDYLQYPDENFIKEPNDGRFICFSSGEGEKPGMNKIQNESAGLYEHNFSINIHQLQIPLINTTVPIISDLMNIYFDVVGQSRKAKKEIVESIKSVFLPSLEDIEIRKINEANFVFFAFKHVDLVEAISTFGESVVRLFHIILELQHYKGQRLMIDEIDTGIHHSRMKGFLKAVIKAAELNEVQLFMTTHSLECQQQFVEVFEEPDMAHLQETLRNFTLVEDKQGKISAIPFNYGQLEHALNTDFETRG